MASQKPRPKTPATPAAKASPTTEAIPSALFGAGLVIGLYAMLPAIFNAGIHLRRSVEIVDHVVPGIVVLALTVFALMKAGKPDTAMLAVGVVVVLAGFWMVMTHIGLARQALHGQASGGGAAFHISTAVAVAALGIAWTWRYRAAGAAAAAAGPAKPSDTGRPRR
jgi:hypothetical protein